MVVFRREGVRMMPWYLLACLLWGFVGLLVATFLLELLPIQAWSLGKAVLLVAVESWSFQSRKSPSA
jgi:hypothetical protein